MKSQRSAHGRGLRAFGIALGTLVLLALILFLFAAYILSPPALPSAGILATLEKGSSAADAAQTLKSAGAIRSAEAFRILIKARGMGGKLKAGTYRIEPGMNSIAVLDLIVSGRQAFIPLRLREGLTLSKVAAILEKEHIADSAEFLKLARDKDFTASLGISAPSLEGYLFPDTYNFPTGYGAENAIRALVGEFRKKIAANFPEAASLSPRELEQKVILASIVESEYSRPEEAPLMASVFYNRLKKGMRLESCATVVYVITEHEGRPHPKRIWDSDLEISDPYNCYQNRGLPPGPICSPGLVALDAAFHPASSKYLFFRLIDVQEGRHYFSETLEEHDRAAGLIVNRAKD